MRITECKLANTYAVTVTSGGGTQTLTIDCPDDPKLHACDIILFCDNADTWSKDITFRIEYKDPQIQTEDFAFWDDSALTVFSDFMKLLNRECSQIEIHLLNNDGANDVVVTEVFVRWYFYD